ncbi:ribonuclease III [Schaalia sp. lx-100]|uniref:ribonuclease III n=1 Tax=Schaalia sp. lx-100 TaxID=2899081 RepID=UPI001E384BC7|nr:ribonuclease III [Schaalia sp. lx-100]MCD4556883.1 ribonuclease III [Schaalia sp. lx-100]
MSRKSKLPQPPQSDPKLLLETWGVSVDAELLDLALVHRSWANEAGGLPNNERLEFLGDSVLSIVTAEYLYTKHPDLPESDLSRMRAATVAQEPLALAARRIHLGDYIRLGRGEHAYGGRDKDSILSDTFEALVGATYLTHGFAVARIVVLEHLGFLLERAAHKGAAQDWKTTFVEYALAHDLGQVRYEVEGRGPDHCREFTAYAFVEALDEAVGQGSATSKKHAEHAAARAAVEFLRKNKAEKTA